MKTPYSDQVRLLVNLLPIVEKQTCFALKGGTAINLFIRDMPRLSVDIDLTYLPIEARDQSLEGIHIALGNIIEDIKKRVPRAQIKTVKLKGTDKRYKLLVQQGATHVKIEVTPVLRGSVYPSKTCRISENAEKTFGFASMTLLSFEDLFAGKICATLDRQHPRDLYDTYWLLQHEGITQSLKNAFMIYLIGHNRPMAELLSPKSQNISSLYRTEFEGMAYEPIDLGELQDTLPELVIQIHRALNDDDRQFLLDLKQGNVDWRKFPLPEAQMLPAIQWKQLNLERMAPNKRRKAAHKLEKVLFG
ncbi:MAG: nucleotidyl transferase AbiEii/AbiGii toxin family protein [Deltaproteobacteria bacterium]|uniref:nucleotidyl transferase AbiEii/AbiGii toxin family protein n=1 Tax=Desulfobacula sp. TaxID=2593537 RepID=UPI00199A5367|nr:nucleotidyl transferase AbiEii/AbiGii toxin family protein [Candidatus Desulfobacula maris]MBL6995416.1 nucleotidyl transferase AbiEii/AbiGii toxin family protein [Desulfobacula sp.]